MSDLTHPLSVISRLKLSCVLVASLIITGCVGKPDSVHPVDDFDLDRYLGKWYEIARLDHAFERGLEKVTAEYAMRDDGGVRVINRGYAANDDQWQEAVGKAYFVKDSDIAHLKVSFFGPFYGSYIVFELDRENYQYAFVSGPNHNYLWLLARTPDVPQALIDHFIETAGSLGFDTREMIVVSHD